ncbi:MAG: YggT family protein [Firmicutes bacterium]|nr:YggT family protein [Bacillota bacterium]
MIALAALVNLAVTVVVFGLVLRMIADTVILVAGRERVGPALRSAFGYVVEATEPLLAPIRRVLPRVAPNVDFSPLVAIILVDLVGRLLIYLVQGM